MWYWYVVSKINVQTRVTLISYNIMKARWNCKALKQISYEQLVADSDVFKRGGETPSVDGDGPSISLLILLESSTKHIQ